MIQVEGLRYTYPGAAAPAVRGMSFAVEPGEVFGLLGPSGAGKSTTQKVLIGLLRGYEGSVRLFGRERRELGRDVFERVGVGFELPNLYGKLTARENLAFFASLYRGPCEDPDALLAQVGLSDAADVRVSQFSKGMKMRLNFCRALLHRPELVFLDEPTSGQDPGNARRLRDVVLRLKAEGRTVFLTTHDMQAAQDLCDRVAFVVDGGIRLIDSPRALRLAHGRKGVRLERRVAGGVDVREFPLEGLGANASFLSALREGEVETLHTLEAGLDDIFVQVTGRALA